MRRRKVVSATLRPRARCRCLEQLAERCIGFKGRLQMLCSGRRDRIIRVVTGPDILFLAQKPDTEIQVLSGKRHQRLKLEHRQPGVVGVRAAPLVQQIKNTQPSISLAFHALAEFLQPEHRERLRPLIAPNVVIRRAPVGIR